MAGFALSVQQWVPLPRSDVIAFFADAFQLESLTPQWLQFRVLTKSPFEMQTGRLIDYRLRLHGLPVRWRTEITAWEPPYRFEDSQLRGPYRQWQHEHLFEERDGGTLMTDRVRYAVLGGRLMHELFVRRDLQRIFEYRQQQLPGLLGVSADDCLSSDVSIRAATSRFARRLSRLRRRSRPRREREPDGFFKRPDDPAERAAAGSSQIGPNPTPNPAATTLRTISGRVVDICQTTASCFSQESAGSE